jgi:hypothetical protein
MKLLLIKIKPHKKHIGSTTFQTYFLTVCSLLLPNKYFLYWAVNCTSLRCQLTLFSILKVNLKKHAALRHQLVAGIQRYQQNAMQVNFPA